ncbi:MAG: PD40 domain-containing protein [Bacteroidaceae bacterium]|nr:PD40 domain-containing protein [Bacteroidaceae bacterium]
MKKHIIIIASFVLLLAGCSHRTADTGKGMFPDYSDVTIPCNIAPLNFRIDGAGKISVTVKGNSGEYRFTGRKGLVKFPVSKWHSMLEAEKGSSLNVNVEWNNDGNRSQSFTWTVASDSIDRYMSYRLIEPAYEVWNGIQIEQRDMESFRSVLLGDNRNAELCCMNCHTTNRNGTTFMHLRGAKGGTILNRNGKLTKLNTRTENTGGGVYGDISADGRYGVFTTADITFAIHSRVDMRMEVFDKRSDLVVVDFDNLTVTDSPATSGEEFQETFPCFSADGRTIFFCRAVHHEQPDSISEMHYDIAVVQFDPETGKMGDRVITIVPAGENLSFSHLKASPDGHWLMATAAQYGTFPVWHKESDIWLIDLQTRKIDNLPVVNAFGADTYHSWSSNSRWVVFASKRDDMVYGRPYIAYVGPDGKAGKPFLLPQKDPDKYLTTLKSFNLPELYTIPEVYDARDVASFYNSVTPEQVQYKP